MLGCDGERCHAQPQTARGAGSDGGGAARLLSNECVDHLLVGRRKMIDSKHEIRINATNREDVEHT